MDDVQRALERAAKAVLERFFGGSSGLKEYAEAIARDHARAAVLAFLKEMPYWREPYAVWVPSTLAAAIEKEQP